MRRKGETSNRAAGHARTETLEARRFLAGQITWDVSFYDPSGAWSAYYQNIQHVVQGAGHEWARLFDSTASIQVRVRFDATLPTASGRSLAAAFLYHAAAGLDIYEQGAAAEINTGTDPNGAEPDVELTFGVKPGNNYLADLLWFDPEPSARVAGIPTGRIDAMSLVMHELGHALGYNGWADYLTGHLPGDYASTFDQYIHMQGAVPYFGGAYAHAAYGSDPPLTVGNIYHWGNVAPTPGADLANQLMNGVAFGYEYRYDISDLDVAVMRDLGMNLETTAPVMTGKQFEYDTAQDITLNFDESVRSALDPSDLTLLRVGPGAPATLPTSYMNVDYDRATDTATVTFPGLAGDRLADGTYQLTVSAAGVRDLAGNPMPGDQTLTFFVMSGDANHDGQVNIDDYFRIDRGWANGLEGFVNGDFDYSGGPPDADDYFILDEAFRRHAPGVLGGAGSGLATAEAATPLYCAVAATPACPGTTPAFDFGAPASDVLEIRPVA
jgi:hypothetical protein